MDNVIYIFCATLMAALIRAGWHRGMRWLNERDDSWLKRLLLHKVG